MAQFYNPYQFVPVMTPQAGTPRKEFAALAHATHERYVPGTNSGLLIVKLTTVTPLVVGAEHHDATRPQKIDPYRVDGRPAIPGSTLRGLVGSVMEAATNAPLRVLENRAYSYRKGMRDKALSAIGLVVRQQDGKLKLWPMCLPTLESRDGGRTFPVPEKFKRIFPMGPQFKVLLGRGDEIRKPEFPYRTSSPKSPTPVEKRVKELRWSKNGIDDDNSLHVKNNRYAISQLEDEKETTRKGFVRVLGCWGERTRNIPKDKKHELWIPLPHPKNPPVAISEEAIKRFEQLADERTERDPALPYEPKDTRPEREKAGREFRLRLQHLDIVYFDMHDTRNEVSEVSFSSIWRGRVEDESGHAATAHRFFDPKLLPFSPRRGEISIAEQMLGFAEDMSEEIGEQGRKPPAMAFASRLKFTDGMAAEGKPVKMSSPATLKILDSPKLPCPSLYFKARSGRGEYIGKRDLKPTAHAANGRKTYLHLKVGQDRPGQDRPWASKEPGANVDQKSTVEPIAAGETFFFHIDFDNLTDRELGLLLFAIEPNEGFHHKLGMGKPLGLGSVKLEVLGYAPVDREKRYSIEGLRGARYTRIEITAAGEKGAWPGRYAAEWGASHSGGEAVIRARKALDDSGMVPGAIRAALRLLGDYVNAPGAAEVHYPTRVVNGNKETEHYAWFVENDRTTGARQFLKPLLNEKSLPGLAEN